MQQLNQLLKVLIASKIDFILIGGYAGVVHGSNQLTRDLDICLALTPDNISLLRQELKEYNPRHRMNPNFKPSFIDEPKEIDNLNAIYLETDLGVLDVLGSVISVGVFEELNKNAVEITLFGHSCKIISLDDLIKSKEAMGRDKDKIVLHELYAIKKSKV